MKKLKIGITCYPTYGGSGVVASEIGMAMARRGHKVHFICAGVPRRLDRFQENVYFHEVEIQDYPVFVSPPYALSLASKMVEVSIYEKLDILHAHYAVPHATSAYLAKQILGQNSPKILTTLHGTDITLVGNSRSYLPITRFSIIESDGVTTPSIYLKQATYDKLNVPSDTAIEVIPNFVDTAYFAPLEEVRRKRCSDLAAKEEKLVVHVSNFRPVKRLPDVVKVFSELTKNFSARLVLIGDGPERAGVLDLIRAAGLENRVRFLGKLESFVEVLQQADLFLLPSETESFGLAALEAMSCGVPVIATNAGGLPEVIVNGKTGFLADVGDTERMVEGASKLLADKDLWCQFSQEARKSAVDRFEANLVAARYEEYYGRFA
jgi:L-malate glycosyltransferase